MVIFKILRLVTILTMSGGGTGGRLFGVPKFSWNERGGYLCWFGMSPSMIVGSSSETSTPIVEDPLEKSTWLWNDFQALTADVGSFLHLMFKAADTLYTNKPSLLVAISWSIWKSINL